MEGADNKHFSKKAHESKANVRQASPVDELEEKPKLYTVQKYRKQWEKYERYKHWLCEVPGDRFKARCRFCNITMSASYSVLNKHIFSKKHMKSVPFRFQPKVQNAPEADNDHTMKTAEVLMCAFLVSHDLPFKAMDELDPILKECFADSYTARDMKLRRTKASSIVRKVIFPTRKEELIETLRTSKFSVIADVSPGSDVIKQVCVVVCYNSPVQKKIVNQLWEVLDIMPAEGEDEPISSIIYRNIISSFVKCDIPVATNIIGFAAEINTVLHGSVNSVSCSFEDQIPGVVILDRICLSVKKVVAIACKLLPEECEDLARSVHVYLRQSSKRQDALESLRPFLEVERQPQGCWLSHMDVIDRMLNHWEVLQEYFSKQCLSDKTPTSESIHNSLHDGFILSYFKFLKWMLPKFILFDNDHELTIVDILDALNSALVNLLSFYMPRNYLMQTPLKDIDPTNELLFMPLSELQLYEETGNPMQEDYFVSYPQHLQHFLRCCRSFLITACHQLKLSFNFGSPILESLSALNPKNITKREYESLIPLLNELPKLAGDSAYVIEEEWRRFHFSEIPEYISRLRGADAFWNAVSTWHDDSGTVLFPNLSRFVLQALSLPYASAECERIFMRFYTMHGRSRTKNGICTETLKLLMASECIRSNGCCVSIKPTEKMFQMINKDLYKSQSTETSQSDVNYIISYFMDE